MGIMRLLLQHSRRCRRPINVKASERASDIEISTQTQTGLVLSQRKLAVLVANTQEPLSEVILG